jgi:hypothetical protein
VLQAIDDGENPGPRKFGHRLEPEEMPQYEDDLSFTPEESPEIRFEPKSGEAIGAAIAVHRALGPGVCRDDLSENR